MISGASRTVTFTMKMSGTEFNGAGCWAQQGHIIRMTTYVICTDNRMTPVNLDTIVDVPDTCYR